MIIIKLKLQSLLFSTQTRTNRTYMNDTSKLKNQVRLGLNATHFARDIKNRFLDIREPSSLAEYQFKPLKSEKVRLVR